MKNKTIGFFIVALIFLSSFTSSFAIFIVDPKSAFEITEEMKNQSRASASAEFKMKLKDIRDTKKQKKVDRINSRLPEINKKRTDQMLEVLTKMTEILNRIDEKSNQRNRGDRGNLLALIGKAQIAIDTAKAEVTLQSQKEYIVTITTEGELKLTVGKTVSGMEQDLRATREKVISARKAVVDAFSALMQLKGGSEATGSATKL